MFIVNFGHVFVSLARKESTKELRCTLSNRASLKRVAACGIGGRFALGIVHRLAWFGWPGCPWVIGGGVRMVVWLGFDWGACELVGAFMGAGWPGCPDWLWFSCRVGGV